MCNKKSSYFLALQRQKKEIEKGLEDNIKEIEERLEREIPERIQKRLEREYLGK